MSESLLDTVLCIIHLTPIIPLCNGFYLFPLSRAVISNSLIFDPSEFKIGLYLVTLFSTIMSSSSFIMVHIAPCFL